MQNFHTSAKRPYMLWLKNAFILFCLVIGATTANAQTTCQAGFIYSINNGTVSFTNTSTTSSGFPMIYYWDFGDGSNSSTQKNPTHTYSRSGWYAVSLGIFDSVGNCKAGIVDSILITGICNANFSAYNKDLTVGFYPGTIDTNVTYSWSFGDGSSSSNMAPSHIYADTGTYMVCLTIRNLVTSCSDSSCKYVTVRKPIYCNAVFDVNVTDSVAVIYFDTTYAGYVGASYSWNLGDNSTSTAKSQFSHIYSDTGTYTISLTVKHDSCTSNYTKNIRIKAPLAPAKADIYGRVYLGTTSYPDAGIVYLIKADMSDTSLMAIDTVALQIRDTSGYASFEFPDLDAGTYFVKAALSSTSAEYKNYLPTYGDSALLWQNASAINLKGNDAFVFIHMKAGTNAGGAGFIGGKVVQGANKKEGDPLKDIQIILFNENRNPVTYTYSDADGKFNFENLAFGRYEVYTEVPGLITMPGFASISETSPKADNIVVKVSSEGIVTSIKTKTGEDFIIQPRLYPNPAKNILYLETNMKRLQNMNLVVYNITGQQVYAENISLQQGNQTTAIDTEKLPAGLYMLYLKNASGTDELRYKFVKTN